MMMAPNQTGRIMLVEDDATMRGLLQTLLEIEGFQVLVNVGADESAIMDGIRSVHPDLLLLDVHLRNANGLSILKQIKADGSNQFPVLMSSGMDLRLQCQDLGADGFLMKPYSPDDLIRQIRSLCT